MARSTIGDVIEALRQSFQGIDLRAVVVALGDQQGWQNAFTVIRFSAKSPQEISAEHERLKRLHELPPEILNVRLGREHNIEPYKGMKIALSAHAVGEFERLVGRMQQGILTAGDVAFRVFDSQLNIDPMCQEMDLLYNRDYEDIGGHWPAYHWGLGEQVTNFRGAADGQIGRLLLERRDLDRQSRSIGFRDFQQLVESITGESFQRGTSGQAFQIFVPVYARMTSVILSSDAVEITGLVQRALGELILECSVHEYAVWERDWGRLLGRVRVNPQSSGWGSTQFSGRFELGESPRSGYVEAFLFKQTTTRIDLHLERSPLKSGILAFRAFTSFVPEEDITEYLRCLTLGTSVADCRIFLRFTPKDKSKKNDELFEYVVTHLLGLSQLSPILLSNPQYDVIQGDLQAGSADIVASTQDGEPILVSCTMTMPDARKRNMVLAARTAIANRTGMSLEAIRAVLVTGKPSLSSSTSDTQLVELAATDLERLWDMCRQGNLSDARRLLGLR